MFEFKAEVRECCGACQQLRIYPRVCSCERSGALVGGQPHPLEKGREKGKGEAKFLARSQLRAGCARVCLQTL